MIFIRSIFFFLFILTTPLFGCKAQTKIYDGFETKKLSPLWSTDRMVDSAIEMQSVIVRNGHSAAKITLKTGDVFEAGDNGDHDSERDELCEVKNIWSAEDKKYIYGFSLFLPANFPIVPVRLVIAQWKQKCPHDSACSGDSPVMAIRYVSGKLYVTLQTDTSEQVLFQTSEEMRNKWLDFKFNVCFSSSGNGTINTWLNEKQIINFNGTTCYTSKKGYIKPSLFYFKMGLYRNVMRQPMTIYIDEFSKNLEQ